MSITVNTNMQALKIQQNLSTATNKMNTAMERMSSGFKINSAKDDAAGLAVSTRLETTVSSSKIASSNVQIGSNLLDTSEGTLDTINSNLSRIRDLTEQAATGTYSSSDKQALATEINQRVAQINSSATGASFNGIKLLDGSLSTGLNLQVGTDSTSASTLTLDSSLFANAQVTALGLMSVDASNGYTAQVLQPGTTSGAKVYLYTKTGASTYTAISAATDTSTAINNIISGTAYYSTTYGATVSSATLYSTNNFLDNIDKAISNVTDRITKIGAYQNRLGSVSDSLTVQQTNLTSANSTIKDADVAEESASYVQQQILQSASASLLTQANSAPQIALTLIKG